MVTNSERNLEENHTHFLLCDSKTEKSLHLRGKLEEHIIKNTHPENKGTKLSNVIHLILCNL